MEARENRQGPEIAVSPRLSRIRNIFTASAAASLLAASLFAAAPAPQFIDELDEVVISAKKLPPLEAYIEYPDYDFVSISPGGTRLAMAWTNPSYTRLLTVTEFPSLLKVDDHTSPQHMGASDLRWASERMVLVQPDYPTRGFRRVRETVGSLFVVNIENHSGNTINTQPLADAASFDMTLAGDPLTEQRKQDAATAKARAKLKAKGAEDLKSGSKRDKDAKGPVRWVAARTGQPEQSLFQTVRNTGKDGTDTDGYGVFQLNLADVSQTRVAISPLPDARFVTGPDGRVALATGINDHGDHVIYYLPPDARAGGKEWQLRVSNRNGERGLRPIAWTGRGEEYYALDGRGPMRTVVAWNAATNTQRLLYSNPYMDMNEFALDPSGKPWMFAGVDHYPVYWYPDRTHPLAVLHQMLTKRLLHERVDITSASDDLATAVVRVSSGSRTPVFLVMNVKTGTSVKGMQTKPRLRTSRPGIVESIEFKARDGLLIHGYLTTPVDADGKPRRRRPMVVIAQDAPGGEPSDISYEYERQLFASRGYAVLQVNHRGSSGRGMEFERAGDGKWGREVQQDFADGVRWAIHEGVAAEGRICFYGTHYGAYSALMTVALDPALFSCAIGAAGVYDLPAMFDDGKKQIPPALQQVLGNDMQELRSRSPVSHAAAIQANVLLIQQSHDDLVPKEQFALMRKALQVAGKDFEVLSIGDAFDGFFVTETRAEVYERMLKFLGKTVGN